MSRRLQIRPSVESPAFDERFEDAMNDAIALSELAMDMVETFSSRSELVWIQNGFKPARKGRRGQRRSQRPS
jgi:hypothetical protein